MSYYQFKDKQKFSKCTHLISRGVLGSSSAKYATEGIAGITPDRVNVGIYHKSMIVGISVNGQRRGRVGPDRNEIYKAAKAGVTFVTDNTYHTGRDFNVGEREVATYLERLGYKRKSNTPTESTWTGPVGGIHE